jgi:hypothetical protein
VIWPKGYFETGRRTHHCLSRRNFFLLGLFLVRGGSDLTLFTPLLDFTSGFRAGFERRRQAELGQTSRCNCSGKTFCRRVFPADTFPGTMSKVCNRLNKTVYKKIIPPNTHVIQMLCYLNKFKREESICNSLAQVPPHLLRQFRL